MHFKFRQNDSYILKRQNQLTRLGKTTLIGLVVLPIGRGRFSCVLVIFPLSTKKLFAPVVSVDANYWRECAFFCPFAPVIGVYVLVHCVRTTSLALFCCDGKESEYQFDVQNIYFVLPCSDIFSSLFFRNRAIDRLF